MRVSEAMTRDVYISNPDETIQQAALAMAGIDAGALPVADKDRLIGMITDRDIAIRGVAEGKSPNTKVRDVMTTDVKYCFEDDSLDEVMQDMSDIQIRRMPVLNRNKRLVGIISLADAAMKYDATVTGAALGGVTEPGGPQIAYA